MPVALASATLGVVLSLGVFKALNDQGIRPADWSPVGSLEATF